LRESSEVIFCQSKTCCFDFKFWSKANKSHLIYSLTDLAERVSRKLLQGRVAQRQNEKHGRRCC
jgi:hypothetical protein